MNKETLKIETVHQCNSCLGNKTWHPLVSAIDLSKATLTDYSIKVKFYTVLLIENESTDFIYGRKYYDYSNATLVFLSPGQSLQMDEKKPLPRNGWLLAFHPHLICGTALGATIQKYTFFSYHPTEALHLSMREKAKAIECLLNIKQELQQTIDRHSQVIISRHIELLLDYSFRFYERQFITRCEENKQTLNKMEQLLDEYMQSDQLKKRVLPSSQYCSDRLHLSSPYFNDLLKFETGKTIDGYFQLKRIEVAKRMLLKEGCSESQVADFLGFSSVQHFSRLFHKITGVAPNKCRITSN